jgi:hypothetical protein
MVAAAGSLFALEADRLRAVLRESGERLAPLGEPLLLDFGAHRWLSASREEAYSDWLAWIVEQSKELKGREAVFRLFGIDASESACLPTTEDFAVEREVPVLLGHEGRAGRLDLLIWHGQRALIVVEAKTGSAEEADCAKHLGYVRSVKRQFAADHCYFVLLAVDGEKKDYYGFRLRRWSQVCVELRKCAAEMCAARQILVAAMILGFVGAVEQNLMRLPGALARLAAKGGSAPLTHTIAGHIRKSLEAST